MEILEKIYANNILIKALESLHTKKEFTAKRDVINDGIKTMTDINKCFVNKNGTTACNGDVSHNFLPLHLIIIVLENFLYILPT